MTGALDERSYSGSTRRFPSFRRFDEIAQAAPPLGGHMPSPRAQGRSHTHQRAYCGILGGPARRDCYARDEQSQVCKAWGLLSRGKW